MPRGGARVGAGRKPKDNVLTMPGAAGPAEPVVPDPPADMVAADEAFVKAEQEAGRKVDPRMPLQSDIWREYAPAATANGTLIPSTLPGFRYLVEVTARYRGLAAIIDLEGWQQDSELMGRKKHPLWTEFRGFAMRRETALRSYGLLANGKPVATKAGAETADPWADRARRRKA